MKFSVVIASWNEGAQIGSSLKRLRQISQTSPMELIVVDGGSNDGSVEAAREWADEVITLDKPNRGAQLDAGARRASGDLLFFLRADAQPPGNWQQALEHFWLATHPEKVAATGFSIDYGSSLSFRLASRLANSRASWRGVNSGEHGLCTTPELYANSGGFPHYPFGEDIVFCERISRFGKLQLLKEKIWPAGRRMHRSGAFSCMMQDAWLGLRFKFGAKPEDLFRAQSGI